MVRLLSPSDKINIAGIGVGGKGTSDLWYASNEEKKMLLHYVMLIWESIHLNQERFPKAKFYQDFKRCWIKKKI